MLSAGRSGRRSLSPAPIPPPNDGSWLSIVQLPPFCRKFVLLKLCRAQQVSYVVQFKVQTINQPIRGFLLPATRAQLETCTRNLCKSRGTRNLHVRQSILYKFFPDTSFLHAKFEHSSIAARKLSGTCTNRAT